MSSFIIRYSKTYHIFNICTNSWFSNFKNPPRSRHFKIQIGHCPCFTQKFRIGQRWFRKTYGSSFYIHTSIAPFNKSIWNNNIRFNVSISKLHNCSPFIQCSIS
ncbi:131L [Invertebrate iridescent virus Kaz2018]|uniref:131L n=1 Tax=Invertebrate iridescent virus 6 TaxID=176652 RepID=Q91G07_IIV6|nr:131L [Invertebrate iridescent virus 6]AAK82025.1 131L [Invertebrate iridescent virus 6]QMS79314.1 hypothetical protein IIV6-T1_135 [Invertebrate iridescent virus 6]QNH08541.1 131L [Invertebrate iridescent virus Kaz2018]